MPRFGGHGTSQEEVPKTREIDLIPPGSERILLVDDEELLAELGESMLERLGYMLGHKLAVLKP